MEKIRDCRIIITLERCHLKRHIAADIYSEQRAIIGIFNNRKFSLDFCYKFREFGYIIFTGLIIRHDNDHVDGFVTAVPEDDLNYVDATKTTVIKAKQGDVINLSYAYCNHDDGLQWCTMTTFADWNINGFFESSTDELIAEQGQSNQKKTNIDNLKPFTFKVPDDAVTGKSRIRMIFSDAWYPHPGPVGLTAKGFTIDVGLEISGTNEQRQPPVSPVDEGVADEPDDLNGSSGVDVVKGDASETFLNDGKFNFRNVEKAWIYTADGKLVKFVQNPTVVAADLANGIYIVKMQNKNVIRSQKVTVK